MSSAHLAIGIAAIASGTLFGQAVARPPEFEVASVRCEVLKAVRGIDILTYPGGRITVKSYTLRMLIQAAFDVQAFQVSGGPPWIDDDRCNIEAKPPASSESSRANPPNPRTPPNDEQRQMLQALLMDRFQLRFHRETKEVPVYLLLKGQKLKLKDAQDEGRPSFVGGLLGGGGGVRGANVSMQELAVRLGAALGRPVYDQTGLKGSFDFNWEYAPDDTPPDRTSFVLHFLEEVGLKLQASKGPVANIVVDHAEKPSAN